MTNMVGSHDISIKKETNKAKKAQIHHSSVSELFRGSFPLFVNRYHEGFDLREHDHEFLELVYITSGEGYHYVGESMERTAKGYMYLLPLGTSHILRPSDASGKHKLVVYNLCIRPEFISELKSWLASYSTSSNHILWSIFDGVPGSYIRIVDKAMRLGSAFEQLHQEYEEMKPGYEASMMSILLQLIVHIARQLEQLENIDNNMVGNSATPTDMSLAIDYINEHLTDPLTLESIAEKSGMSQRHFIRLFGKWTGMGFSDYVQHKRMELACRLLVETDHKIDHIANNVGYRDIAHFRQVFRKWLGTSPSEYRKKEKVYDQ